MNNKIRFLYAWLIFVLAAKPFIDWLWGYYMGWDTSWILNPVSYLTGFGVSFFPAKPTILYALAFIGLLIWSFARWLKTPGWRTLLWTLFTAWVLCGYPGALFVLYVDFVG